jgi:hypothetical protein
MSDIKREILGGASMAVKTGARTAERETLQPGEVTPVGNHVGLETKAKSEWSQQGKTLWTITAPQQTTVPGSLLRHGSLKNVVARKVKAIRKTIGTAS